jgi:hypothetical protein
MLDIIDKIIGDPLKKYTRSHLALRNAQEKDEIWIAYL